jgi:uncharacterized protein (DUF952 family)
MTGIDPNSERTSITGGGDPRLDGLVFKITDEATWREACETGSVAGSADDARDGYIHLSAAHQLAGTAAKHFRGRSGLMLLVIDATALGSALRWEASRGGDLFPHLYGPLGMASVLWSGPLALDGDGVPVLPAELARP